MKCREVRKTLAAYLDSEVTPSERLMIEAHLARCESCEKELVALGVTRTRVADSLQRVAAQYTPSDMAWSSLRARIALEGGEARKTGSSRRHGGRTLTRKWKIALAVAGVAVVAASVVAAIPTPRATAGDFLANILNWLRPHCREAELSARGIRPFARLPGGLDGGAIRICRGRRPRRARCGRDAD